MENERLDNGGEEAHKGVAHHTNGNIGILNTGVEQHPVDAQQTTASSQLKSALERDARKTDEHDQDECGEQHSPPRQLGGIERHQPTEQSSETCQQDRDMQLQESFSFLR